MADQGGRQWGTVWLRLAVLGALTVAALGLAADPPGVLSEEPWSPSRPDPETVGALLLGCLVLGGLVGALGLLLPSPEGKPERRRGSLRSMLLVAVVVAAFFGLRLLRRQLGPDHTRPPGVPPTASTAPTAPTGGAGDVAAPEGDRALLVLLVVTVVALVLAFVASRRRPPEPAAPVVEHDRLGAGLAAAAGSLRTTTGDEPRDRVIQAYEAFEAAVGERLQSPGTTPGGLLSAAVAQGAPEDPATRLTEVFTTARFSDRRVTARDVAAAEQALEALLAVR